MHVGLFSIDQFHKSQNVPGPYPTMLHLEQKYAHFCSEWSIVGYGTSAFWDLWIRSIPNIEEAEAVKIFPHEDENKFILGN